MVGDRIIGRQSEGSVIQGFVNPNPNLTLTLTLTLDPRIIEPSDYRYITGDRIIK